MTSDIYRDAVSRRGPRRPGRVLRDPRARAPRTICPRSYYCTCLHTMRRLRNTTVVLLGSRFPEIRSQLPYLRGNVCNGRGRNCNGSKTAAP
ncbi:hypothetical protein EVAR_38735_1 [Eumeta japonica]|uniref:Uncharacterized protein n=1 Tax=Eumeta variegata TaxID=151549 RepID=A0A4C1YLU9_EUMVA|nr:hypothetical protein EVAR_38735_1 [Eumeta japonica]